MYQWACQRPPNGTFIAADAWFEALHGERIERDI
jgi:hypothetical protein